MNVKITLEFLFSFFEPTSADKKIHVNNASIANVIAKNAYASAPEVAHKLNIPAFPAIGANTMNPSGLTFAITHDRFPNHSISLPDNCNIGNNDPNVPSVAVVAPLKIRSK